MWFASLGLVVVMAIGAAVPGILANGTAEAVAARFGPQARPAVRIEADPFLELPVGKVPRLVAELDGLRVQALTVPDLDVVLTDVRVPPAAVWGLAKPRLLSPAGVAIRVGGRADALQRVLDDLVGAGGLRDVPLPKLPLGKGAGGPADFATPRLELTAGRVGVAFTIRRDADPEGTPVGVSFAPTIEDGTRLVATELRATIGGRAFPSALVKLMAGKLPAIVDLAKIDLPGTGWTLSSVEAGPEGLWVEARGTLRPEDLAAR